MRAITLLAGLSGAVGHAIIRASRSVQRKCLGIRVPACRIREFDLVKELFSADREVENANRQLAYWLDQRQHLEAQIDAAWREGLALMDRIDALSESPGPAQAKAPRSGGESWPA